MNNNNNNEKDFAGLGKVLNHEYDEIRELDNPLPGWWLATFWITIVFSVGYYAYYEMMGGPTLDQELNKNLSAIEAQMAPQESATTATNPTDTEESLKALATDSMALGTGKSQYDARCLACHGAKGEGQIGPNLTDDYWIHGDGSLIAMKQVVAKGVLEKGMPAWETMLKPDELNAVVAYVHSLLGTNPPNAKAAQGEKKEHKP